MRFSRARYVTLCQQSLVTAAVLAVGVSAAGVKTLDIVPQPGTSAGTRRELWGSPWQGSRTDALTERAREAAAKDRGGRRAGDPEGPRGPGDRHLRETPSSAAGTAEHRPSSRDAETPSDPTRTEEHRSRHRAPGAGGAVRPAAGARLRHGRCHLEARRRTTPTTRSPSRCAPRRTAPGRAGWTPSTTTSTGRTAAPARRRRASERPGTDALVIGDVDRVQMRAETTDGTTPPDLKLAVIDPGTGKMTKQAPAIDTAKLPPPTGRRRRRPAGFRCGPRARASGPGHGRAQRHEGRAEALHLLARPVGRQRADARAVPPELRHGQGGVHPPHGERQQLHLGPGAGAAARHLRVPHAVPRLARHRLQLPRRPVRPHLGRPLRRRQPVRSSGPTPWATTRCPSRCRRSATSTSPRRHRRCSAAYARLFAWKLSLYNIRGQRRAGLREEPLAAARSTATATSARPPARVATSTRSCPTCGRRHGASRTAAQSPGRRRPPPPAPTTPFTSPTQTPLPAAAQPAGIAFPRSLNLTRTRTPTWCSRLAMASCRSCRPAVRPASGPRSCTTGAWAAMNLIAAVGDLTGDGKGDVLGRVRSGPR